MIYKLFIRLKLDYGDGVYDLLKNHATKVLNLFNITLQLQ